MKAMIFAAGLGTRLKPLTDVCPKALVDVDGITLLEHVILRLRSFGYDRFIVNVHHFADQVIEYLQANNNFGVTVEISDETDRLLDTGGGLLNASWFFDTDEPFLVHNVDILSNIDLHDFRRDHVESGALVTLAVSQRKTSRVLLFGEDGLLAGWKNLTTDEVRWARPTNQPLRMSSFSGIHMVSPGLFKHIKSEGKFSIIDTYLNVGAHQPIHAYFHDASMWMDVGKHESLESASALLDRVHVHPITEASTPSGLASGE